MEKYSIISSVYDKQAPKIWNDHLDEILVVEMGMVRCPVMWILVFILTLKAPHVPIGSFFFSARVFGLVTFLSLLAHLDIG